jgi:hypothetical protein
LPIEKPLSVADTIPNIAPILAGVKDPFLYNPRKSATAQASQLSCAQNISLLKDLEGTNLGCSK